MATDDFQYILNRLLKVSSFKGPFSPNKRELTYRAALENRFQSYIRHINKLKGRGEITKWLKANVENIQKSNKKILDALDMYLKGNSGIAYEHIDQLFSSQFIKEQIRLLRRPLSGFVDEVGCNSLYRVRESSTPLLNREDIFHIPFENRYLVKSQRYSIAGVPCLYLGKSLHVCWHEMGKPDLNSLYLSRYCTPKNSGDVHVLDFAYSLETLKHTPTDKLFQSGRDKDSTKKKCAYLAIWPLLMASSFANPLPNASFIVEYIIPNLIIQWISHEKREVSGIKYLSTHMPHIRYNENSVNYAFPPSSNTVNHKGLCPKLMSMFELSKPISWQILGAIGTANPSVDDFTRYPKKSDDLFQEMMKNYASTSFSIMEEKLRIYTELKTLQTLNS